MAPLSPFLGKTVLITGGTGSFGRAFTKKLLQENACQKVIIFSRDEWKQWEMKNSHPLFCHPKMRYFLGDVRDENRLERAFNEVDIVIHAAALKQVPAAEYNPSEFIKTNVMGGMNVIDAAINCKVEKVIALSTDKAVNPVNMYGATKLCADKLFIAGNSYVGKQGAPTFSVVRYGNVAASRASLIPYWKCLLDEGRPFLPITDMRMTRFWISLKDAVDFVMQCIVLAKGGEIFIPKIPSFKVSELAEVMAPTTPTQVVGIREGEKLHEMMIGIDDARHTLDMESYYVIVPEMLLDKPELLKKYGKNGQATFVPEGFWYGSDVNKEWLHADALKMRLREVMQDENL